MKRPDSFLTNTITSAGRALGEAKDNPGDDTGTGVTVETYNDPAYANIAVIESYKESGISDSNETTEASDMRDALEEMVSKKVDSVSDYNPATIYSTKNTLVMQNGYQFVNFNATGNQAYNPLLYPDYWYKSPSPDKLMDMYYDGMPQLAGFHPVHDRVHSNYNQNILLGKYRLGTKGNDYYNFYMVHLDGTTITGDTTLEAIFTDYWNLDIIAPDVAGTRSLLDLGEYITAPQSSGGENDTVGSLLLDRFQGHYHDIYAFRGTPNTGGGIGFVGGTTAQLSVFDDGWEVKDPITDGINGTPRTGLTTRPKEITVGASYIIVMIAA